MPISRYLITEVSDNLLARHAHRLAGGLIGPEDRAIRVHVDDMLRHAVEDRLFFPFGQLGGLLGQPARGNITNAPPMAQWIAPLIVDGLP